MIVVGLMSGTSADGIDVAILDLQGAPPQLQWQLLHHHHCPYTEDLRREIGLACDPERSNSPLLCQLQVKLGRVFAEATEVAVAAAGLDLSQVDLIGSHGQTIWHCPSGDYPSTLQLGDAATIAEQTGVTVISDLRSRDLAAGGQGAPLVSYVDVLLFSDPERVRVAQNLGGIANLTYLPALNRPEDHPFAFDTGPGNLLIDALVARFTAGKHHFDPGGAIAAAGQVQEAWVQAWLQDSYLQQPPPKTTGREHFGARRADQIWQQAQEQAIAGEDLIATVTALTARSIAQAYRQFLPQHPDQVIISGGGALNQTLMQMLQQQLQPSQVFAIDQLGIPSQAKEAMAFGILAYESWHGRPGNLPQATGATRTVILGQITPAAVPVGSESYRTPDHDPLTESRNPATEQIDTLSTLEMVERICQEDARVAPAVALEKRSIAAAIEAIHHRMEQGGRLIYLGAGTSGRLGVLDAAECPPTFSTDPDQVIGLIAGGNRAIRQAVEGAEDNPTLAEADLRALQLTALDSVVGIAASGSTPYVLGGIHWAHQQGALTVGITCNRPTDLERAVQICIVPQVGAEVIMGSTRLKAGTAQKLVLNLISTGVMIRLGKTFGNLMVDLQPTNAKLRTRCQRILALTCDLSPAQAQTRLVESDGDLKVAIVMTLLGLPAPEAREKLQKAGGRVRAVLRERSL